MAAAAIVSVPRFHVARSAPRHRRGDRIMKPGRRTARLVALAMLIYAFTLPAQHQPLSPVLNQIGLLPLHVSCAVIAYGLFALGFVCGVLYIAGRRWAASLVPSSQTLDSLGYSSTLAGFCFMTLVIAIGSVWAKIAWGTYWSWDPKETAALVTWLIYGGYLVTRLALGWRDSRSAWFLVAGFMAVLVTYFGNYFFGGLHSYATSDMSSLPAVGLLFPARFLKEQENEGRYGKQHGACQHQKGIWPDLAQPRQQGVTPDRDIC
jgi:hypothetical protein